MPMPPNEQEKQQFFGEYGFQPLRPIPAQQTQQLAEELTEENPPLFHEEKHPMTDAETLAAEAILRADRTPTDWQPHTTTFDGVTNYQLCGIRPGRETVAIFNGTGNVLIAKSESGLNPRSNDNFTLFQGASCSIDTEGEIWAFSSVGITVSSMETYYDLAEMAIAKTRLAKSKRIPVDTNGRQALGAR
jgi:hypothetical protein